jgi:hypothetical protein
MLEQHRGAKNESKAVHRLLAAVVLESTHPHHHSLMAEDRDDYVDRLRTHGFLELLMDDRSRQVQEDDCGAVRAQDLAAGGSHQEWHWQEFEQGAELSFDDRQKLLVGVHGPGTGASHPPEHMSTCQTPVLRELERRVNGVRSDAAGKVNR